MSSTQIMVSTWKKHLLLAVMTLFSMHAQNNLFRLFCPLLMSFFLLAAFLEKLFFISRKKCQWSSTQRINCDKYVKINRKQRIFRVLNVWVLKKRMEYSSIWHDRFFTQLQVINIMYVRVVSILKYKHSFSLFKQLVIGLVTGGKEIMASVVNEVTFTTLNWVSKGAFVPFFAGRNVFLISSGMQLLQGFRSLRPFSVFFSFSILHEWIDFSCTQNSTIKSNRRKLWDVCSNMNQNMGMRHIWALCWTMHRRIYRCFSYVYRLIVLTCVVSAWIQIPI